MAVNTETAMNLLPGYNYEDEDTSVNSDGNCNGAVIACGEYNLLTYGAEPFLRSRQLYCHSRTSQHFMEPEGSIPYSKELSTGPYPEPYQTNPHHTIPSYLSKIQFDIVHPPMSWSSQWSMESIRCVYGK
jgi:hypothetical protein